MDVMVCGCEEVDVVCIGWTPLRPNVKCGLDSRTHTGDEN